VEREAEPRPGRRRRGLAPGHRAGPRLRRRGRRHLARPAGLARDSRRRIRHGPRSGGGRRGHGRSRRPHRLPAARPCPCLPPGRLRPGLRPVPALADRVSPHPRPARGGERRDARWPPADRRPCLGRPRVVGRTRRDAGPARPESRRMAHREARSPRARDYPPERAVGHPHRQRRRRQTPRAV
ncbi:MAG: Thioredoxin reductase, partial [uncultured Rubrobacteraceae bacterium]